MGIKNIKTSEAGLVGVVPKAIYIDTDDSMATVLTANYLTKAKKLGYTFAASDMALVNTTDGVAWLEVAISGDNVSLQAAINPGNVTLPVVDGDFANFDGTTGKIKDSGYSASNAAKTKVVMANAVVAANRMAVFSDTAGTVDDDAAIAVNGGSVQAGLSGTAGSLIAYPSTASRGYIAISPNANAADYSITIQNASHGQSTSYFIPDVGEAIGSILVNVLDNADPNMNTISFDVTVGQAALAGAGSVTLVTGSGSKQYKVRELMVNDGGTDFSGGGGDRNAQITDGTTSYSIMPAAGLQSIVNARWGSTNMPFPTSAAANTSTVAGASLSISYVGGTTDYTAGSMVISGVLERVA